MLRYALAAALLVPGFAAFADDDFEKLEAGSKRTVVIPQDAGPIVMKKGEILRVVADGISGSKFSITTKGKLKVVASNPQFNRGAAVNPIGKAYHSFDVLVEGTGEATVLVKVKPPQPDAEPVGAEYKLTVE